MLVSVVVNGDGCEDAVNEWRSVCAQCGLHLTVTGLRVCQEMHRELARGLRKQKGQVFQPGDWRGPDQEDDMGGFEGRWQRKLWETAANDGDEQAQILSNLMGQGYNWRAYAGDMPEDLAHFFDD